jgi:serine/threonine protein kinase
LTRLESFAFSFSPLESVEIPGNVQFIACRAFEIVRQASLANADSCPEYGRWRQLRRLQIEVDFRRIRRFNTGLSSRLDCLFDLSGFREGSQLSANELFLTRKYQECDHGLEIIVKSMNISVCDDLAHRDKRIESLMNLRHPCISSTIGVVLRSPLQELQIVRPYCSYLSLSEVISTSPGWWTPTAKVKAIVGIVLSMRFAHSFGLLHGHLTEDNVVFNDEGLIQICDFCLQGLSEAGNNPDTMAEVEGFSGERWRPDVDVKAFAELLSRIVIGASGEDSRSRLSVPVFVLKMIEGGQSSDSKAALSFVDIFNTLEGNGFRILEGVDLKEVSNFARWIEFSEALTE